MPVGRLDFLDLPIEGDAVRREGGNYEIVEPWGLARFGRQELRGGWWGFECVAEAGADLSGVEVRLSSPQHPLIVIPAEASDGYRLHIEDGEPYEVTLMLSPWPGAMAFKQLRLRRLEFAEELHMMAAGAGRLLKEDKPLERIARAAGRIMSGKTIGVRTTAVPVETARVRGAGNGRAAGATVLTEGGVTAVLGAGDELHPRAFELVQREFARFPEAQAVYADAREGGAILPRPAWDTELARHADYVGLPVFFREGSKLEGRRPADVLRELGAGAGAVRRIPLPLAEREQRLDPHCVTPTPVLMRTPTVTAVIPTKFRVDLLELCLEGLASTDYPALDVVIVDNGCEDPRFGDVLAAAWRKLKLAKVEDFGPFNFPRLIHSGVVKAGGEVLLLINDDVQAIEPDWLKRMISSVLEPDVGAVGARLLYPDRTVQHAGVMMGIGGACGHLWKGATPEQQPRNPMIACPGQRMAVTGACLAVRRELYDRVGGMDQKAFPVAFNDIDFCLRLGEQGFRSIYRGDAVLVHHESQSRGADSANETRRRRLAAETDRFLNRWRHKLADDPFGSPAFDLTQETGAVHRALRRNSP